MKILGILLIVYGITVIGWLIYNWFDVKHWKTITIGDLLGFHDQGASFIIYFPILNTIIFLPLIIVIISNFIAAQWKKILNIKIKDKTK